MIKVGESGSQQDRGGKSPRSVAVVVLDAYYTAITTWRNVQGNIYEPKSPTSSTTPAPPAVLLFTAQVGACLGALEERQRRAIERAWRARGRRQILGRTLHSARSDLRRLNVPELRPRVEGMVENLAAAWLAAAREERNLRAAVACRRGLARLEGLLRRRRVVIPERL